MRGRCFERFEKSRIKGSLLQYVEQPGHRPALADLGFDRGETPGFGQGFERGERYTVLAAPQQPNLVVQGKIGIEEQQFLSKLLQDGACKYTRIRRQVQTRVNCLDRKRKSQNPS